MDIEQVVAQLRKEQDAISNKNFSEQDKFKIRQLYQNYITLIIREDIHNQLLVKFAEDSNELSTISNGAFSLWSTLSKNEELLHSKIQNSELVQDLLNKGFEHFTLSDLKTVYAPAYEVEHGVILEETNLAISLYEQIESIKKSREDIAFICKTGLTYILGDELLDRYQKYSFTTDGSVSVTPKTTEELQEDYNKANAKIEELYLSEGILDTKTKYIANRMLTELFSYYTKEDINIVNEIMSQTQEKQGMSR